MQYQHILVAIDLMEGSEQVIKKGFELAKEFAAQLSLIHVVEPLPGYGYAFVAPAEVETQLVDEAKNQLKEFGEKYTISEDNLHVVLGPTKVEILETANTHNVDLLVVGTHTRHGWGHLLGSTANAVIHSSECDVLTVRVQPEENNESNDTKEE